MNIFVNKQVLVVLEGIGHFLLIRLEPLVDYEYHLFMLGDQVSYVLLAFWRFIVDPLDHSLQQDNCLLRG